MGRGRNGCPTLVRHGSEFLAYGMLCSSLLLGAVGLLSVCCPLPIQLCSALTSCHRSVCWGAATRLWPNGRAKHTSPTCPLPSSKPRITHPHCDNSSLGSRARPLCCQVELSGGWGLPWSCRSSRAEPQHAPCSAGLR